MENSIIKDKKHRTDEQMLFLKWRHMMGVCIKGRDPKRYVENTPIDPKWKTFKGFLKDNLKRFQDSKIENQDYQFITTTNPVNTHIHFIRKIQQNGYTKDNTIFTTPAGQMKYHKTAHRYIVGENDFIGTREMQGLLAQSGIDKGLCALVNQKKLGKDVFEVNRLRKYMWNGKMQSLVSIAKLENISYSQISTILFEKKMDLKEAVLHCKNYIPPTTYLFEGQYFLPIEICRILSERHGILEKTIYSRFLCYGLDLDRLLNKSTHKLAPYPKKIIAEKEGVKLQFNSIREAAKELGISSGNLSTYVSGKKIGLLKGYKFYFLEIIDVVS